MSQMVVLLAKKKVVATSQLSSVLPFSFPFFYTLLCDSETIPIEYKDLNHLMIKIIVIFRNLYY